MKKSRFSESQIFSILKEVRSGKKVSEVCRTHGISEATFYKWRSKFSGMDISMMKRLKELEAENSRLKKMYAEAAMDNETLKEILAGKY
jgi:putative transposase